MLKILVLLIVVGFVLWRLRVPILAKVLGQDPNRVERQLDRRKNSS